LYALAEELRGAGDRGRTAKALADTFEVSERTIKRDVAALQQAGLALWAESGRNGGYRFLRSRSELPSVDFTAAEAAAVAIALGTQRDLPFASEGSTALTKILNSMAAGERTEVADLLERVGTDTSSTRTRAARTIDEAIRRRRVVNIDYVDRTGVATTRALDPIQFVHVGGRWYLQAHCHLRDDGRWFRLDRINRARLTGASASDHDYRAAAGIPRPETTLLARRWRAIVE